MTDRSDQLEIITSVSGRNYSIPRMLILNGLQPSFEKTFYKSIESCLPYLLSLP